MPRRRTSYFLDEALKAGLRALKDRDGIPEAEAVRRAVAAFLKERGIELLVVETPTGKRGASRRKPKPTVVTQRDDT
jgi:hypothetical protein